MGQHYEEQILQFESQNDFQTEAVAEKNYIKLKNLKPPQIMFQFLLSLAKLFSVFHEN